MSNTNLENPLTNGIVGSIAGVTFQNYVYIHFKFLNSYEI